MTNHPPQSDRAFGLMFAVFFMIVATVIFFFFETTPIWTLAAAILFLVVAVIRPGLLMPLNRLWGLLARRLGQINNYILLGAFFYVFIMPAGLVMRIFVDPMRRRTDSTASSYWSPVNRKADAETYRDLF